MTMQHASVLQQLTTLADYIRWTASRFNEAGLYFGHGTSTALDEAAALVLYALNLDHDLPQVYFSTVLLEDERLSILELVDARIEERKPLAYLTQESWFCGLQFYVDERVLVPRSPIAELIENQFRPWVNPEEVHDVLDLCTGSGCIAIACAYAFPEANVDAVDISLDALDVTLTNITAHDLTHQVSAIHSDLFSSLEDKRYDLIVSNPPYVNLEEWEALPEEFHAEPRLGLEAGQDGLDIVRRMLAEAGKHLKPEGVLIVEVGSSAMALQQAFPEVPFWWLDFEHGGDGVFLLTASQIDRFQHELSLLHAL